LNTILSVLSALYPKTSNTLKVLGLLFLAKKIIRLLYDIYRVALRPRRNFQKRYGRNTWALVTGSSEGIGKGIAIALAKQGFNLILSARTESKLDVAKT
jgi:17beta-estradiol 17-dehydrogenase / very-long-chain 3-oxoacyl-CoA reductase